MAEKIGDYLRELRTSRGISLSQLATKTSLARRTLSYWEANTYQPHLPELNKVLEALNATKAQSQKALALIQAPRAIRQLRAESNLAHIDSSLGHMPAGGDLLRAMRQRSGLYLEQTAQTIGVSPATLSRWEKGNLTPSAEALEALLTLLNANPDEKAALKNGFTFLSGSLREENVSYEILRENVTTFIVSTYNDRANSLHDLYFLSFASAVWRLATLNQNGRDLLADIYASYGAYLSDLYRYKEAKQFASWALDLREDKKALKPYYARAAIVYANASVNSGLKRATERALELLSFWLPQASEIANKGWMLEDMARYHAMQGNTEAGIRLGRQACQVAEENVWGNSRLRKLGLAKLLLFIKSNEYELAYSLIESADDQPPFYRVDVELVRAETLLGAGERNAAESCFANACAEIEAHDLTHFRKKADELMKRLSEPSK